MTAMTANASRPYRAGDTVRPPVAAGARIFAGALVEVDADGNIQPATQGTGKRYLGVALEPGDNRNGAAGAIAIAVRRGTLQFQTSGTAVLGRVAYAVDDQTVTDVPTGATALGRIVDVDEEGAWVDLRGPKSSVPRVLTATEELNFPAVAAAGNQDLTIDVAGAEVGDAVFLGAPSAPEAGLVFQAFVSAADTVTVRAANVTAAAIDPAAATFRATLIKA